MSRSFGSYLALLVVLLLNMPTQAHALQVSTDHFTEQAKNYTEAVSSNQPRVACSPLDTDGRNFEFEAIEIEEDERKTFQKNLGSVHSLAVEIFVAAQRSVGQWGKYLSFLHHTFQDLTCTRLYVLLQVFRL